MKTKSIIIVAASLGLIGAVSAKPEQGKKRPEGHGGPPVPAEVLEKFDTDKDGKLSKEERDSQSEEIKAAMEEHKAAMLEKFDTDKDGELSKEERKAMMMEKFDTDGDGTLSDAEKEEMKKSMGDRGPRGEKGGKGGKGGKKDKGDE
ncbi:EF-hand domain-containing protein [Luteolibacter sp. AS25]|uniref:EF-hand domain-containing protein n=1 Tax=Luteolibacter sp. AS25 TaxID=3135776 RepID=UPI00398B3111